MPASALFFYCCGCFSFHVFCVKTSIQGALSSAVPLHSLCSSWPAATLPMLWCPLLAWVPEVCVWWTTCRSCPCCKLIWPSTVLQRLQASCVLLAHVLLKDGEWFTVTCLFTSVTVAFFFLSHSLSLSHLFLLSISSLARTSSWVFGWT